jgi:hypothetical protein
LDHQLSPHEHNRIYNERIKPEFLDSVAPSDHLRAVILGGQSGSGKSTFAQAVINDLGGPSNVVRIDTDALRAYHPKFDEFAASGKMASNITQPDAQAWRDRLEGDAIAGRRNLVIDSTLAWTPNAVATAEKLRAAGYQVEAIVVSAHRTESQLGIEARYYGQLEKFGKARFVDRQYHDNAYPRIPDTVQAFEEKKLVSAIRIVNREGRTVQSRELDGTGEWNSEGLSSTALKEDRERRGREPFIIANHFKNWHAFEHLLVRLNVSAPDRAELAALRREHELELVGRIHERGPRAQAFLTMGIGEIRTKFPNDESLKNAALTLKEAEKFAAATLDNDQLKKMVIDDVRYKMADQLDKNARIERPVEKSYTNLDRKLEREGPASRSPGDDLER